MYKVILKIIIVLSSIGIVSGLLLGAVNYITAFDEDAAIVEFIGKEFSDLNGIEKLDYVEYSYDIGKINNIFLDNDGTYIFQSSGNSGYGGDIVLLVAIKDNIIMDVVTYSNNETPGLGSKVLQDNYLNQYIGADIYMFSRFSLGRGGGSDVKRFFEPAISESEVINNSGNRREITGITGATKSSNAVNNAVNCAVLTYKEIKGEE